ncbi:MAG: bifunctional tRNA pseudouridine(32) synthase/ribosomal large subunit pseudouridine synthase RluA, partial [Kordiimonadaceae bacterium]|nr:bifunctional tRNA pseudouridine(32) synthase/ribosomal large subunit pseudouridine synthase RluA [Kordiimonadaceae bacterium]
MHILAHYEPPTTPWLDVLYVDEHLLVLNKQSGLLSVPGKHEDHKDCLQSRAIEKYPTATTIHRLDMETSGVIVMALTRTCHAHIGKQFERRKTKKFYTARLMGLLEHDTGTIDLPLRCDWPNRPKQMVDHTEGRQAQTHFTVLERETNATRVEFRPVTGRSHQLRVHALSMGHPILGDSLYGDAASRGAASRLQLHAKTLVL